MKKGFLLLLYLFIGHILYAQAPQKFSYQSIIRNSSGTLLINTQVGLRISILKGEIAGTSVYTETHTTTTDGNGLISLEIGTGTVTNGLFGAIDWSDGPYFIKVETDPTGGTNYTLISTSQLLSVPYALYAEKAGNVTGVFKHYVGEVFGGGVVASVFRGSDGKEHGLIVSVTDQADALYVIWSNVSALIGPAAQSTTDGSTNTDAIIAQPGHTSSAALLCRQYRGGDFTDWYLPAIEELKQVLQNSFLINSSLEKIPNSKSLSRYKKFYQSNYWSSTENDFYDFSNPNATYAFCYTDDINVGFPAGITIQNKTGDLFNDLRVRAIRRF